MEENKMPNENEVAAESNETTLPAETKSNSKKKKLIIFIAIILVYTALVSGITVAFYRSYLQKQITESFAEAFGVSDETDDADEKKKEEEKATPVSLQKKFFVNDMFEITLEKSEWVDEIKPSGDESYSCIADVEGETYFVIYAKVKNISGQEIDMDYNSSCSLSVNGKYNMDGVVVTESSEHDSFYGENIKPLKEANVIFYASASDEVYKGCQTATMTLKIINNEDAIGTFLGEDSDYNLYSITFNN